MRPFHPICRKNKRSHRGSTPGKYSFFHQYGRIFIPAAPDPVQTLLDRLRSSRFRARFHLDEQARAYLAEKGLDVVMVHGAEFIRTRLAPAHPARDGKQTPMRGHPVFIAQHATGSCCRSCLAKWHGLSAGRPLTSQEQDAILAVLRAWIIRDAGPDADHAPRQGTLF